jgi:hypothetical protein
LRSSTSLSSNIDFGTNDLYLIKKLKESGLSAERISLYIKRLKYGLKNLNLVDIELMKSTNDLNEIVQRPIFGIVKEEQKRE